MQKASKRNYANLFQKVKHRALKEKASTSQPELATLHCYSQRSSSVSETASMACKCGQEKGKGGTGGIALQFVLFAIACLLFFFSIAVFRLRDRPLSTRRFASLFPSLNNCQCSTDALPRELSFSRSLFFSRCWCHMQITERHFNLQQTD